MKALHLSLLILLLTLSFSLASQLAIKNPTGTEYCWGTLFVSASFIDDYGSPISDADVYLSWKNSTVKMTYNSATEEYETNIEIIKMGDYTLNVHTQYGGENFSDSKQIYINSSRIDLEIIKPSGSYGPGTIPVKLKVLVGGEEREDVSAAITVGNISKTIEYPYSSSVDLGAGEYELVAEVSADNSYANASTSFNVSEDVLKASIVNPKNQTYSGTIPIDVDVWSNGVFVHHLNVTGLIYSNGELVRAISIPESQEHYSAEIGLDPGYYKLVVEANNGGNIVRDTVFFGVEGIIQTNNTTTVIPKEKEMSISIVWTDLKRRYYAKGAEGIIAVLLKDPFTGLEIKNANVTCCVSLEKKKECFNLEGDGLYKHKYMFGEEGWYEISVNASALGYETTSLKFPPILVGKPELKPPAGYEEIKDYIFTIMSPEKGITYPEGKGLPLRIQLLTKDGMPVDNANVTAEINGWEFPMDYDINGEYTAETEALDSGEYDLTFTVSHNETTFKRTMKVYVSANKLNVEIVFPTNASNITSDEITIQAMITDQSGDIVPDADVKAILTSPESGAHSIKLTRNLKTGYYEINYTLDAPGKWKLKVTASKLGLVSGESETEFTANFEKEFFISTKDIVAGAIILASIIIIIIIVRAMI